MMRARALENKSRAEPVMQAAAAARQKPAVFRRIFKICGMKRCCSAILQGRNDGLSGTKFLVLFKY
jgi:hypothetical protein